MKSIYKAHLSGFDLNLDTTGDVTHGFRKYSDIAASQMHRSRPLESDKILLKVTEKLLETTYKVTPRFRNEFLFIPRRTLTHPREASTNFGYDNIMHDYILRVKETIGDQEEYEILDLMGRGTFGQVVKCKVKTTGELVAIKITKRDYHFSSQSIQEIKTLTKLNGIDTSKFLQLRDHFFFRGHTCAVLELLSDSLYKYASSISPRPAFKIDQIQCIGKQILETLSILKSLNIIHADLKPDNILFKNSEDLYNVKLIDYGSALDRNTRLVYPVQTASYRAPEVILRLHYSVAIDMWSFGCLIAEMFLGKSLFPSENEGALLHMMVALLNQLPPAQMISASSKGSSYFFIQNTTKVSKTRIKTGHGVPVDRMSIEQRIMGPISDDPTCSTEDKIVHEQLVDFLQKILTFDPSQRLTPDNALKHPFITSAISNDAASSDIISTKKIPNLIKESGSLRIPPRESNSRLAEESVLSSISTTSTTIADSNHTLDTPATEDQEETIIRKPVLTTTVPSKQPKSILKTKSSNKSFSNVRFDSNGDTTFLYDDISSTHSADRPKSALPFTDYNINIDTDNKTANQFYQQPRPSTAAPVLNNNNMQKTFVLNSYNSPPLHMVPMYQIMPQYPHYPLMPQ